MVDGKGKRSFYEILAIPAAANSEQVDKACWQLWNSYKSQCTTALWKEVKRQVDGIHDTLLDPQARAGYDELLAQRQGASFSIASDKMKWSANNSMQPEQTSTRVLPKSGFRKASYLIGVAAALLFNQMIDWLSPQTWSDVATAGWLVLFFSLTATCLLWAVSNLRSKVPYQQDREAA